MTVPVSVLSGTSAAAVLPNPNATFDITAFSHTLSLSTISNDTATVGDSFNKGITCNYSNTAGTLQFSAIGLPAGLNIDPATGTISGTPVTAGSYDVTVIVTDGLISDRTSFTLTVKSGTVSGLGNQNTGTRDIPSTGDSIGLIATGIALVLLVLGMLLFVYARRKRITRP
jgi:LPXTG-motif cell wall-anchored protein